MRFMLTILFVVFLISSSVLSYEVRIDCHPEPGAYREKCEKRGCLWSNNCSQLMLGTPCCIFPWHDPRSMVGYDVTKYDQETHMGRLKRRNTTSLYGNDYQNLIFQSMTLKQNTLAVKISPVNSHSAEFHPNVKKFLENSDIFDDEPTLIFNYSTSPFGFFVSRPDGTIIFDSVNLPGFTFSEQFILLSTRVPTPNVYGIGEQWHPTLRRDFQWKRFSLLTRDNAPVPNMNLYGYHPFYMGLDSKNQSYGVYLHSTYPMDVFLQPDPEILSYRIIGGDVKMFFFAGPTAEEVIQQYTAVIGRPLLPPFWSLGFHLSRYGYKNITNLKKVWDRQRAAYIPQDVQVIDIDYMNKYLDFTVDSVSFNGLQEFVQTKIHGTGRKLVPIFDPGIASRPSVPNYCPLDLGLSQNVFIRNSTGYAEGKVWPGYTYFPDFTHPNASSYWTILVKGFHDDILEFDGMWNDMNDPSNFVAGTEDGCAINSLNNPPFIPVTYDKIYEKTLCMDTQHHLGPHYQWHNYYGHYEAMVSYEALSVTFPYQRPYILTRSTSPGTGQYASHWMGDTFSDWPNLRQSIIALTEFTMFGIPMAGTDICGFNRNTNEELCLRWSQLGAFYPFARNHNSDGNIDQDPAVWQANTTMAIRKALRIRYSLLPYLYTLMFRAHTNGNTVARPLFFDFASDENTWNLGNQFLWGTGLMVAPILEPYSTKRTVYFPPTSLWYDINRNISRIQGSGNVTINIPKDQIGLFIKGGNTIFQNNFNFETDVIQNTQESRRYPFKISSALSKNGESCGELFWDDGVSNATIVDNKFCHVEVLVQGKKMIVGAKATGCPNIPNADEIYLAGIQNQPRNVTVNGENTAYFSFNDGTLRIYSLDINLKSNTKIIWN